MCFWEITLKTDIAHTHRSGSALPLRNVLQKHFPVHILHGWLINQYLWFYNPSSLPVCYCKKNKANTAREFSFRCCCAERLVRILWSCIVPGVNTWQLSPPFTLWSAMVSFGSSELQEVFNMLTFVQGFFTLRNNSAKREIYLSIHLIIHPSNHPSTHSPIHLPIHSSIHLSTYPHTHTHTCPSIYPSSSFFKLFLTNFQRRIGQATVH